MSPSWPTFALAAAPKPDHNLPKQFGALCSGELGFFFGMWSFCGLPSDYACIQNRLLGPAAPSRFSPCPPCSGPRDWLAPAPSGLAGGTHPQEMKGQHRSGAWSGHIFPARSQHKSAQAVFEPWLCNPDFFSLFTF